MCNELCASAAAPQNRSTTSDCGGVSVDMQSQSRVARTQNYQSEKSLGSQRDPPQLSIEPSCQTTEILHTKIKRRRRSAVTRVKSAHRGSSQRQIVLTSDSGTTLRHATPLSRPMTAGRSQKLGTGLPPKPDTAQQPSQRMLATVALYKM